MYCQYFQASQCHSCTLMVKGPQQQSYADVLQSKFEKLKLFLNAWAVTDPIVSEPHQFMRNKAKMAAGGTTQQPILGIPERSENPRYPIEDCPIHHRDINQLLQKIPALIRQFNLTPYNIVDKKGELKFVLVNRASGSNELMLRFVLRSKEALDRLRLAVPALQMMAPQLKVITVNLQPEHSAVIEGREEILLTQQSTICAHIGEARLLLGPGSFFQTNDAVASKLYKLAASHLQQHLAPGSKVLDLFCGVGGFAQHLALAGFHVHGFEFSSLAVMLARLSQQQHQQLQSIGLVFEEFDLDKNKLVMDAQAAVINPPRRGLSLQIIEQLRQSALKYLLYSSCNPETLKRDLELLGPNYAVKSITPLDMFPWTEHWECLAVLVRK